MAFGFPAYHTEELDDLGPLPEARGLVIGAIDALGWSISSKSKRTITASTGLNLWSYGEKIVIEFLPDEVVSVTSKCSMPTQCFDWGKNKANVWQLIAAIEEQK